MSKTNRQKANKILEDRPQLDAVYMNHRGEFFTEEYQAENSAQGKKITTFKRAKKKTAPPKEEDTPQTEGGETKEVIEDKKD